MASPQVYDRFFGYIDGKLLGESDSISVEYQGTPLDVATMVKEFAGVTPVPKMVRITIESFVPAPGFEFDAIKAYLKTQRVKCRIQFGGSGKIANFEGYVDSPSIRSSATDNTKLSFSLKCSASAFA